MAVDSVIDTLSVERPSWAARLTIVAYLTALVGAQASATLISTEVSLACDAAVLLVLLNHFALAPASAELRTVLAGLALVPLLRIEAVALPQRFIPSAYWEALPAALMLATVFGLRRIVGPRDRKRSRSHLTSLREWWPVQLVMPLLGVSFASGSAYALSALDLTSAQPRLASTPATVLLVAALSGVMLEIVFRGVIQPALVALCGWHGIALTSLLYAGLFIGSASWFFVALALITGVVWGSFSALTRRVSGVAGSHALFAMMWAALY